MRVAFQPSGAAARIGSSVADKASSFTTRRECVFSSNHEASHPRLRSFHHPIGQNAANPAKPSAHGRHGVCSRIGRIIPPSLLLPLLAVASNDYPRLSWRHPPELWSEHNRELPLLGWQHRGAPWAIRYIVHSSVASSELGASLRISCARTVHSPPRREQLMEEASGSVKRRTTYELSLVWSWQDCLFVCPPPPPPRAPQTKRSGV